jgi:hypothetical protein
MSKASEKALSDLHAQLATVLKEGLGVLDEFGRPNSSLLSVARQFLKDNHIETGSGVKQGPLHGLADLPMFSDEDEGNVISLRKNG